MQLKFTKLDPNAVTPVKSTDGAAGFDLVAISAHTEQGVMKCRTGLAVAIPKGYAGFLFPRSSIVNTRHMLANAVGVIDSDYRGEIIANFTMNGRSAYYLYKNWADHRAGRMYENGDRVVQLVIMPVPDFELVEVASLDDTERGAGGFGSTGR